MFISGSCSPFLSIILTDGGVLSLVVPSSCSCIQKIPHSKFYIYPTIKENKNSLVEGMVFDVSEEDMKNLDRYETHLYRRLEVILQSGIKALAYIENN